MSNIDIRKYINMFIDSLEEQNYFNENIFVDKNMLFDELVQLCENRNVEDYLPDGPFTHIELNDCIYKIIKNNVTSTINDMVINSMVNIAGMDMDGNFLYTLNTNKNELN